MNDERGNLTLEFIKIVETNDEVRKQRGLNPSIVFWENVEGVLTDKTNAFGLFISSLAGLETNLEMKSRWPNAGFIRGKKRTVAWRILDAKYFGLPQQRRRLYVIAGEDRISPENILFEYIKNNDTKIDSIDYDSTIKYRHFEKDGHDFGIFRDYSDCLFSSYGTKWNGNASAYNGSLFIVQDGNLRRLSPRECERIMGFPDDYTYLIGAKKTNRYQALGNSWAIPVIKWIGERIANTKKQKKFKMFPMVSGNDIEYHDLSNPKIKLGKDQYLNCSERPENTILGHMEDIVCFEQLDDILISPVGAAFRFSG